MLLTSLGLAACTGVASSAGGYLLLGASGTPDVVLGRCLETLETCTGVEGYRGSGDE